MGFFLIFLYLLLPSTYYVRLVNMAVQPNLYYSSSSYWLLFLFLCCFVSFSYILKQL